MNVSATHTGVVVPVARIRANVNHSAIVTGISCPSVSILIGILVNPCTSLMGRQSTHKRKSFAFTLANILCHDPSKIYRLLQLINNSCKQLVHFHLKRTYSYLRELHGLQATQWTLRYLRSNMKFQWLLTWHKVQTKDCDIFRRRNIE